MAADDRSTMDLLRGSRITSYSIGLVCLIAGVLLLVWPSATTSVVARILGVLFIVVGFGQAAEAVTTHRKGSYWGLLLLRGVINFGIGIALVFWTSATTSVIVWLVGLDFVVTGVLAVIVSFMLPKEMGRGGLIVQGLISIALGAVIFWAGADSILNLAAVVIGIVLIALGALFLWSGYQLSKARAVVVRG